MGKLWNDYGMDKPAPKPAVTKRLRDAVTKVSSVTKVIGRPPKFRNDAERQKAYRERLKNG